MKKCIEISNTNPDRCNEEGRIDLATDIILEMTEEEVIEFIKSWGYTHRC